MFVFILKLDNNNWRFDKEESFGMFNEKFLLKASQKYSFVKFVCFPFPTGQTLLSLAAAVSMVTAWLWQKSLMPD